MRMSFGTWMLGMIAGLGMCGVAAGQNEAPEGATPPVEEQVEMPDTVYMLMKTSMGEIYLALDNVKAPISVENFVSYAEDEAYNGTVYHRVMGTFMIQGGGFDADGSKRPTKAAIKNEWKNGLKNTRGSIAMARLSGGVDSATNQFFINVVNNSFLDRPQPDGAGYAVFGEVVKGLDVVDAIRDVDTPESLKDKSVNPRSQKFAWPIENVMIEVVRRLTEEETEALVLEINEGSTSEG